MNRIRQTLEVRNPLPVDSDFHMFTQGPAVVDYERPELRAFRKDFLKNFGDRAAVVRTTDRWRETGELSGDDQVSHAKSRIGEVEQAICQRFYCVARLLAATSV